MRRTAVKLASLAALLLGGAMTFGQTADSPAAFAEKAKEAPAKSKLEEMLEKALRDNPDLRLAAAKVAEADAELNRARLLVVQKVGSAYQAVEAQKAAVESAAAELDELKNVAKTGAVSKGDMRTAEQKLMDAKVKLAALEAEVPYLLGKQPTNNTAAPADVRVGAGFAGASVSNLAGGFMSGAMGQLGGGFSALGGGGPIDPDVDGDGIKRVPVLGKTAERIRAALDKPCSLDLKKIKLSTVIAEVTAAFQKANPGLLIKCNIASDQLDSQVLDNVQFDKMPFGAVLVWIEDSEPGSGVVVRDYGLVIDSTGQLPPGAPTLQDFWKGAKGEDKAPAKEQSLNPPAEQIEGSVKEVASSGLVRLTIGSDDGLAKGHTLEVYRLNKEGPDMGKYLGRLRILEVEAKESVGQPINKSPNPMKAGDHVASVIPF